MAIGLRDHVSANTGSGAAAATLTATIPATVQVGDLMYAVISTGTAANTVTVTTSPAGWTNRLALAYNTVANVCGSAVYWKIAAAGDTGGAATAAWTLSSSPRWGIGVAFFSGVDQTTVFDGAIQVSRASAGATSATQPSITPTTTTDAYLAVTADRFTGNGTSPTFGAPTGTAFADTENTTSATTQNGGTTIAWEQLASSAAVSGLSTSFGVTTSWNTISDLLLTAAAAVVMPPRNRIVVARQVPRAVMPLAAHR